MVLLQNELKDNNIKAINSVIKIVFHKIGVKTDKYVSDLFAKTIDSHINCQQNESQNSITTQLLAKQSVIRLFLSIHF